MGKCSVSTTSCSIISAFEPAIQVPLIIVPIKGEQRKGVVEQPVRLMVTTPLLGKRVFPLSTTHSMDVIKFIGDDTFKVRRI